MTSRRRMNRQHSECLCIYKTAPKAVLTAVKNVCKYDYTDFFCYSYCELSVKEEEKAQRAEEAIGIIDVMVIAAEIPIPQQI